MNNPQKYLVLDAIAGLRDVIDRQPLNQPFRTHWQCEKSPIRIGRAPENDVQLLVQGVSRTHATIRWRDEQWWISDCRTITGTKINGEQLGDTEVPIRNGAILAIGPVVLAVTVGDARQPAS